MRTMANAVVCLFLGVPLAASAGEDGAFPPLPPLKVGSYEMRISTAKRGLSMLPTEPPPPPPRVAGSGGIGGGGGLVGDQAPPRLPPPRVEPDDRGSKVGLLKGDLEGDAAWAQETFAAIFPKQDPLPLDREAHFDWLPHYEDHPVWNIGWWATVEEVEADGDDAWTVRVRLRPRLVSMGLKTAMADYVEETYRLEGETIRLIDSDAKTPKSDRQVFPVFF